MKTYTVLIILILIAFPVFSKSQQCVEVSFDHLKPPEGGFCFSCLVQSQDSDYITVRGISPLTPTLSCFKRSIADRQSARDLNTSCENGISSLTKTIGPMCRSNNYVQTTASIFHEISQCLDIKDPSFFFALLNRESRFQITAESSTGASCYGQLTGVAIADINQRFIPITVKNHNKCKSLLRNWKKLNTVGNNKKTNETICTAHSNPYSCLFYSGVYYKSAVEKARKLVKELDIITVKLHSTPNKILSFRTLERYNKYFAGKDLSDIKEKKSVSIFQDRELVAQSIALQGYNGGPKSIRNLLLSYTNDIKGSLWSQNQLGKIYKKQIFSKQPYGIPSSDFIETFGKYVEKNYINDNRIQTGTFAKKVLADFHKVTNNIHPSCGNIPAKDLSNPKGQFKAQGII